VKAQSGRAESVQLKAILGSQGKFRMSKQLTKSEVITLIQKIRELGDADHARDVYRLANEAFPEWEMKAAFKKLKENHDQR